jgi:hypothetical protein
VAYPNDSLMLTVGQRGTSWELYSNAAMLQSERLEEVTPIRFAKNDERLVIRAASYGTGNIQIWAVVDVLERAPRRWLEPPLDAALTPLVGPGERIGKHYEHGARVNAGKLELAWLVYRAGDPNCCPTGGVIKVRLIPATNGLSVDGAWREPCQ